MEITEIKEEKQQYLPLLLEADPSEKMIGDYLDSGHLYVMDEGGVVCVAVVLPLSDTECELKNIAVASGRRGRGYGSQMVAYLSRVFAKTYSRMLVGTANSSEANYFYEKNGFRYSHTIPGFFTNNYEQPIYENGVQAVDMICYIKELQKDNSKGS